MGHNCQQFQDFTKTWRVQNTGTCPWTTNFKLVFVRGEAMSGQSLALSSVVATGQKVDISVNLKVPNKTGKLSGVWSLVDEKGQYFRTGTYRGDQRGRPDTLSDGQPHSDPNPSPGDGNTNPNRDFYSLIGMRLMLEG